MQDWDIIIVGAGAAGLTSALYSCRKQLRTLIISRDVGGQTNLTNHIENYPGVDPQPGPTLMQKFLAQAQSFGAELLQDKVVLVEKNKNGFQLTLDSGKKLDTRAVILAQGKEPRKLNIPGESTFFGKGLSTCVTCDGPLFKKKTVVVIGGGNAAVEGAIELAGLCAKVYLVHRRDTFRADEVTVKKLSTYKNLVLFINTVPIKINGQKFVTGLSVKNAKSDKTTELAVDGVFSEIGHEADVSLVQNLVKTNEQNEILVDDRCRTSCKGIFACGDITQVPYKQTVIAAGEGAKAALEAHRYLTGAL